jgi:hypothetical protein
VGRSHHNALTGAGDEMMRRDDDLTRVLRTRHTFAVHDDSHEGMIDVGA